MSAVRSTTWWALGAAALKFAVQLVAIRSYGYFRDELYYLACANHLAAGYVDHPPFSIVVLAGWRALFGDSLIAIRIVPAFVGALLVFATGQLAVELGGDAFAVVLACLAVVFAPALISVDHIYSMNAFDHLVWSVSALFLLRALRKPKTNTWLLLGVALGLGLENKLSVLWFGAGLASSLVVTTPGRAALRTRGPYLAALIAAAIFSPHLFWQIRNHFPTAEFARNALALKYVRLSLAEFLRESTLGMNPASIPLVFAGIVIPFTSRAQARARPLSILFLTTLVIIAASRSAKAEYLDAAYPLVYASGATAWAAPFATKGPWTRSLFATVALAPMALYCAVTLPFALPILDETAFVAYAKRLGIAPKTTEEKKLGALPQHYADMHGWPELVDATANAFATLSPEERSRAKIWAVTGGYGPAAAIDVLGGTRGLPHAISTHNNYWIWGYGDESDAPVVLLGGPKDRLSDLFTTLDQVGTVECGDCMPYENHKPIYVGRQMKKTWGEVWPALKHFE